MGSGTGELVSEWTEDAFEAGHKREGPVNESKVGSYGEFDEVRTVSCVGSGIGGPGNEWTGGAFEFCAGCGRGERLNRLKLDSYAELDDEYPLEKSCNSCGKLLMGGGVPSSVEFSRDEGVRRYPDKRDEPSPNKPTGESLMGLRG